MEYIAAGLFSIPRSSFIHILVAQHARELLMVDEVFTPRSWAIIKGRQRERAHWPGDYSVHYAYAPLSSLSVVFTVSRRLFRKFTCLTALLIRLRVSLGVVCPSLPAR